MDDHLLSFIERFKGDDELYKEATAKLEAGANDMMAKSISRGAPITAAPHVEAAPASPASVSRARRLQESIARSQFRPVFVIRDNRLTADFVGPDSAVWRDRLLKQQKVIDRVIPCVGRVEVNNNAIYNWAGTGWLIDSDVIVTNRHVASIFSQNREGFAFKMGFPTGLQTAKIDFLEEDRRDEALEFAVDSVLWMSENLESQPDVAFLRVNRVSRGTPMPPPIRLAASASPGEIAITIGYPARVPDVPDQELVRQVFGDVYDKKRLAPGEILKVTDSEIEHDCSTLGGNSGSAVVSLATGEALGLHFAGLYMEANYAVPAPKLRDLLSKLQSRSLPGMRAIEVSSHAAPIPAAAMTTTTPSTGGGRTFTLEDHVPIKVTLEVGGAVSMVQRGGTPRKPGSVDACDRYLSGRPANRPGPAARPARRSRYPAGVSLSARLDHERTRHRCRSPEKAKPSRAADVRQATHAGRNPRDRRRCENCGAGRAVGCACEPGAIGLRAGVYREPPTCSSSRSASGCGPSYVGPIRVSESEAVRGTHQDRLTATIYSGSRTISATALPRHQSG
jgi:hypothetical protein